MSELIRRIGRIETLLGHEDCICEDPTQNRGVKLVLEPWTLERMAAAEATLEIHCPVHGARLPKGCYALQAMPSDVPLNGVAFDEQL